MADITDSNYRGGHTHFTSSDIVDAIDAIIDDAVDAIIARHAALLNVSEAIFPGQPAEQERLGRAGIAALIGQRIAERAINCSMQLGLHTVTEINKFVVCVMAMEGTTTRRISPS